MSKKKYVKPELISEEFVPQEYVATCITIDSWGAQSGSIYHSKNGDWIRDPDEEWLGTNDYFNGQTTTQITGRLINSVPALNFDIEEYGADKGTIAYGSYADWVGFWYTIEVDGVVKKVFCQEGASSETNIS